MIGIAVEPGDLGIVREFFELFKTPWEPAVPGRRYGAVVSTIGRPAGVESALFLAFAGRELEIDRSAGVAVECRSGPAAFDWAGASVPLYRGSAVFAGGGAAALKSAGGALDYRTDSGGCVCRRIGYDLFDEVSQLLSTGQPAANALMPTLDLHIALLRSLLKESGIPFLEVEPRPAGHEFICCLTHDIDFHGIRRHGFDRTLAGFAYRASVGSLAGLLRGRRTLVDVLRNWAALASLPLVMLGVLPDFWRPLDDYERADGPRPSTFFIVPFRDRAGEAPEGGERPGRGVKYQASDVAGPLAEAAARGRELAVHGVDAWHSEAAGRAELAEVAPLAGRGACGVRMHWLYFRPGSAATAEAAGFDYDSTCGYNDAVGYRAGTLQAYKPEDATHLLELPLAIMDTAMFYPDRLNLAPSDALARCREIVAHATRSGGAVVVNWHDRSLAPERLWGRAYAELLAELDSRRPWFATAADAVAWFRWRRSVSFATGPAGEVVVTAPAAKHGLPAASVTIQRPDGSAHGPHPLEAGASLSVCV